MTMAELILELRATRDLFTWQCDGAGKSIHGFLKTGDSTVPFNPLRAVCFIRTKRIVDEAHLVEACAAAGISSRDGSDITEASTNSKEAEELSSPDIYIRWLRRQLVFAVGLNHRTATPASGRLWMRGAQGQSPRMLRQALEE